MFHSPKFMQVRYHIKHFIDKKQNKKKNNQKKNKKQWKENIVNTHKVYCLLYNGYTSPFSQETWIHLATLDPLS